MKQKFEFWKSKGFYPNIIYDIGAHRGHWTDEMKQVFPLSTFHLFEGCSDNNIYNKEKNYNNVLLGKEERLVDFYCMSPHSKLYNTGNSIYRELTPHYSVDSKEFYTIKSQLHMLDKYIIEKNIPYPDFIKLDVQGAELDVLEGGKNSLSRATCVLLEVSIHRYNAGAPLLADVISFMNIYDFETIDIVGTHIINGYCAQLDILFAKKGSGYRLDGFC